MTETPLGSADELAQRLVYLVRDLNLKRRLAFEGMLWPRTFLLLGDLAAARGLKDEAIKAYTVFLGLWEHGDPAIQPEVGRVRQARVRLAG